MTKEFTSATDAAGPLGSASSDGLGPLLPERAAFEHWVNTERPSLHATVRTYDESMALAHVMDAAWLAWKAARATERERMIADGWRQTRYAAPVTDCEACLTPDACAIRGQCGHYLRERG